MKLKHAVKFAQNYATPDRAKQFATHMVPHVVRPAQIIWNKALGALFGFMAVAFFNYAFGKKANEATMAMGCFLGAVMLFFCIGSFWRVRKLNRMQRTFQQSR